MSKKSQHTDQCRQRVARIDRRGERLFGEFRPLSVHRDRQMGVIRRWQRQHALKENLARRGCEEIGAAHHMGDPLLGVVDRGREVVREHAVRAVEHEVANIDGDILGDAALHGVVKGDDPPTGIEAQRPRCS